MWIWKAAATLKCKEMEFVYALSLTIVEQPGTSKANSKPAQSVSQWEIYSFVASKSTKRFYLTRADMSSSLFFFFCILFFLFLLRSHFTDQLFLCVAANGNGCNRRISLKLCVCGKLARVRLSTGSESYCKLNVSHTIGTNYERLNKSNETLLSRCPLLWLEFIFIWINVCVFPKAAIIAVENQRTDFNTAFDGARASIVMHVTCNDRMYVPVAVIKSTIFGFDSSLSAICGIFICHHKYYYFAVLQATTVTAQVLPHKATRASSARY